MLLSWDCINKNFFLNLPVTYYLTADRMSLVSPPSSNGWTIPLSSHIKLTVVWKVFWHVHVQSLNATSSVDGNQCWWWYIDGNQCWGSGFGSKSCRICIFLPDPYLYQFQSNQVKKLINWTFFQKISLCCPKYWKWKYENKDIFDSDEKDKIL